MLNKLTGWLIFSQLAYVSLFIAVKIINFATKDGVANQLEIFRQKIGLSNQEISLNDYVCYPLAYSAPINIILGLLFFWTLLKRNPEINLSKDFFNLINAVYVASSSWFFMSVFCSLTH